MDERLYWVGFNLVNGIGAVRFKSLLDRFGDAKTTWDASPADLAEAGLGKKVLERFIKLGASLDLESCWYQIIKQGIRGLIWSDPEYPHHLNEIDQPPPVLYLRGELIAEDNWAVAIVGTRQVTAYGRQVTEELATVLAHNGVTVVEAGETSGALITAEFAGEQGREVYAVPGNSMAPQSKGCNRLITKGARPMLNVEDILEALDLTRNIERREVRKAVPSDATEAALLKMLNQEPLHVDDIRSQIGLPIEKVSAALTMMELKGMVRQVGGMNYIAVREAEAEYQVEDG